MLPALGPGLCELHRGDDPRRLTQRTGRVAFKQSLAFVLGFTIVFVALWSSLGLVGYLLRDWVPILRVVWGAILIVMGLHVAGLIRISALYRQVLVPTERLIGKSETGDGTVKVVAPSYGRSTLIGMAFAAGWTPCVGPILGGIIGLASLSASVGQGAVLLVAYALGPPSSSGGRACS